MSIPVSCSQCGKRFAAPEKLLGKAVRCPECGGAINVRRKETTPPPPADDLFAELAVAEADATSRPNPAMEAAAQASKRVVKRVPYPVHFNGEQWYAHVPVEYALRSPGPYVTAAGLIGGMVVALMWGGWGGVGIGLLVFGVAVWISAETCRHWYYHKWTDIVARELRGGEVDHPRWIAIFSVAGMLIAAAGGALAGLIYTEFFN
jgi:DNA-directed RNA polymerase subunit RPC12/RpoP